MRSVRVEMVEVVSWATLALLSGVDIDSGDRVTFGMAKERAALVRRSIADGELPVVEVAPLEVLFENSSAVSADPA